jgi:molybdopterin converting factor subunit 1|tara:strand:+ start:47640 stop:47882 length:243 start_codon:yes stop_codon:yes gene_type:complete
MQIQLLLFGIVADLIGENAIDFTVKDRPSVKEFKKILIEKYPQLKNYNSYAVAVNETYAQDDLVLKEKDVIAIIPPVSGG